MTAPKIAVITGTTASGKSSLGVLLAKDLDGEIVSADSMQIYRRMDIGTAKITKDEALGVPHHMIDVAEPREIWSVSRYTEEADKCVQDILSRGKLPIVVGGTGLYIDSLVAGRRFAVNSEDGSLRREICERYDRLGGEAMLKELSECDPERALELSPSDKKRIVRALEVFYLTGTPLSLYDQKSRSLPNKYNAAKIALTYESRDELYSKIDSRVDKMIDQGLFSEVQALLDSGVPENCTAMQAIGYKETVRALRGEISTGEAVDTIKRESRRYAKRQLTWLRRDKSVDWMLWNSQPDFEDARRISTKFISASE